VPDDTYSNKHRVAISRQEEEEEEEEEEEGEERRRKKKKKEEEERRRRKDLCLYRLQCFISSSHPRRLVHR
jgi:hypothetical protein